MSAKLYESRENTRISTPSLTTRLRPGIAALLQRILAWQAREAERRHLAELDKNYLTDAGLSCADVRVETKKSFWQK